MFNWLNRLFGRSSDHSLVATDTSSRGVYMGLRNLALSVKRTEIGIEAPPDHMPIWGVLFETTHVKGWSFSLFCLRDGTTSLYLSNGGGIIGGQGHEDVKNSSQQFVAGANTFQSQFSRTADFPIPQPGFVTFYVLVDWGVHFATGNEKSLGLGGEILSPLFHVGHSVISALRTSPSGQKLSAGP